MPTNPRYPHGWGRADLVFALQVALFGQRPQAETLLSLEHCPLPLPPFRLVAVAGQVVLRDETFDRSAVVGRVTADGWAYESFAVVRAVETLINPEVVYG